MAALSHFVTTEYRVSTAHTLPSRQRDWRDLLQLAWPILIAQLAQVGMGITDTVMAGAVSATDLAAVAIGVSLWMPVTLSFLGMLQATTAMVARALGARDQERLRITFQQSIWLALGLGVTGVLLLTWAPWLMRFMAVDPAVQPIATDYLTGAAMGLPGAMCYQVLRSLTEGSNRSKPVMVIGVAVFLINIPLNVMFIFGVELGGWQLVPAMGGAGCGWATGVSQWTGVLLLGLLIRSQWRPLLTHFGAPRRRELGQLVRLGAPIAGAIFMEISIFAVVSLLIGHLGAEVLASHQVAMNVSAATFMVPSALGVALTVKVGNALGAGELVRARRFAGLGAATGILFAVMTGLLIVTLNDAIVALYNDNPRVRELAAGLLLFAAAYQLSDALQVSAAGSLRGYHDTRATLIITAAAYWGVGLPVGYITGLTDWLTEPLGVAGFWLGFLVGLSVAAVLLNWRLARISRVPSAPSSTPSIDCKSRAAG
jgi:MATE family multidrug resistance protein